MFVLHLFQMLVSCAFFMTTIGALCVMIVGCLKSKAKKEITVEKKEVFDRKEYFDRKDSQEKKDPTLSKEDVKKKPALTPAKPPGKGSSVIGNTPQAKGPNMDEKDKAVKRTTSEKDTKPKKSKNKKKGKKHTWDSENTANKPPSSMQSLANKKPKNAERKSVLRKDVPKSLESGEHEELESARCVEVPTDVFLQSGKKDSTKNTKGTVASDIDVPPPSLISKMGEFDIKPEKSGKDKQNVEGFELKAVPNELRYLLSKLGTEQQGSFELVNKSDMSIAVKIKCTNANLYQVAPVFRKLEPGEKTLVKVARMPASNRLDRVEIIYAPIIEGTLPDGGIPAVFKIVDVKDHKLINVPIVLA